MTKKLERARERALLSEQLGTSEVKISTQSLGSIKAHVEMALDDPIVWVLIIALIIFLFGSNKIPEIARAVGKAWREFDIASKGLKDSINANLAPQGSAEVVKNEDPLLVAARREGIDPSGKTKDQIASEIAWKLKNKENSSS